jgi:exodeoxyribonuclease VII large subunit
MSSPSDPSAPLVAPGARSARPISVSELNRAAREVLEARFGQVWIEAEISGFRAWRSGHWYFTLKDEGAAVSAVMFAGDNRRCRVEPSDGMKVLVRGRVSLYEQKGSFQVVVERLEAAGEGALWQAFERLKRRLLAEGLFDAERKRRLPALPRRVGVATSLGGAALRDVLRVLETRQARLHVVIADCRVQGEGAAAEIVAAIERLERMGGLDAILVGRGGGSLEDLWAFNEEPVARAIAACSVPVISAVGHEVDTTIADLVADVRAATPSQAAELVSASHAEMAERLRERLGRLAQAARATLGEARLRLSRARPERLGERLRRLVERRAQHADRIAERLEASLRSGLRERAARLELLRHRLSPRRQAERVRERRERLADRLRRLESAARAGLSARRERRRELERALRALSPRRVLERGYAVLLGEAGVAVRAADQVRTGQSLRAELHRGRLDVEVTQVHRKDD